MTRSKSLLAVLAIVAASSVMLVAQDKKDAKPIKLTKPWNQLTGLTDDQKGKINDIHVKANAARNEIDKKEQADILALLTDENKAELKTIDEAEKAEAKAKRAGETEKKD